MLTNERKSLRIDRIGQTWHPIGRSGGLLMSSTFKDAEFLMFIRKSLDFIDALSRKKRRLRANGIFDARRTRVNMERLLRSLELALNFFAGRRWHLRLIRNGDRIGLVRHGVLQKRREPGRTPAHIDKKIGGC
jgi:hypothetical protein